MSLMANTFMDPFEYYSDILDPNRFFNLDWNINRPLRGQSKQMFQQQPGQLQNIQQVSRAVHVDMVEQENGYCICADLPGAENVDACFEEGFLVIKGENKQPELHDTDTYLRAERCLGKLERKIKLPTNADVNRAVAKYKNGVLHVQIPKVVSAAGTRKIQITNE